MMILEQWQKCVRFGFRLLYNEMAWMYDVVSWSVSLGEWRKWQQAALPFVWGNKVLEIGHGPGHMLLALQNMGLAVVGLDLSANMGRQARKRTQRTVPLAQGMVQQLPFTTAVFDTVLSTFPTDYMIDPATLASIYRILKSDGRFIIVPEGHLHGQGILYRLIDWLFKITGQKKEAFEREDADGRVWPSEVLWQPIRQRFMEAGFTLTIERIQLRRSGVTVLTAHKP
jgi:ubiquinone/menaquinone biosynthesis C-methylase UbiE